MRVGVDVGGTTVKIGFVENSKIIYSYEIETKKESLFDDIFKSIIDYKNKSNIEIDMIGFGIPGNVKNNYINRMPNVGLSNIDLYNISKKYFPNVVIKSSNDANCAALGEAVFDNNLGSSYFITLGTGVGGGYVYNGNVIDGAHAACGEIGHLFIDHIHNFKCTCGLSGCLETVSSATGIVRLAKEYKDKYESSLDFNNITAKDVIDKAKENDPLALYVFNLVTSYLAKSLVQLSVVVDVDTFYIGGGVSKAGEFLIDSIKKYYSEYAFYACKDVDIKLARLGNLAGILGAASL